MSNLIAFIWSNPLLLVGTILLVAGVSVELYNRRHR